MIIWERQSREEDVRLGIVTNLSLSIHGKNIDKKCAGQNESNEWRKRWMYANCQKCGKKLTDPKSMKRGYGPECWYQLTGETRKGTKKESKTVQEEGLPGQLSITDFPEYMP